MKHVDKDEPYQLKIQILIGSLKAWEGFTYQKKKKNMGGFELCFFLLELPLELSFVEAGFYLI